MFDLLQRVGTHAVAGGNKVNCRRSLLEINRLRYNLSRTRGEASKNIPDEIKSKYQDVPWAEMYLLRNKVSHEYFGIDYEIIWDVAYNHLPENKAQIENIIETEINSRQ